MIVIANINNGETQCESGAIYLSGAVRGVPPETINVPLTGTVTVGVYLRERVITEQEDPSLYNPAVGSSAEGEPGAARLQAITADAQSREPRRAPANFSRSTRWMTGICVPATRGSREGSPAKS